MSATKLLTRPEYADWRRSSVRTIEREEASGIGCPHVRIGRRVFYRVEDVERFIASHVRGGERVSMEAAHVPVAPLTHPTAGVGERDCGVIAGLSAMQPRPARSSRHRSQRQER